MPSRIIRDSICTSPTLDALSDGAERLFWRLVTIADDFGRFEADPRIMLGKCFPMKIGSLKVEKVADWFHEMVKVDLAREYQVRGRTYGHFPTWDKYQRVRAKESRYPSPPDDGSRQQFPTDEIIQGDVTTSADTCPQDADTRQHVADIGCHPPRNAPVVKGYGIEGIERITTPCPQVDVAEAPDPIWGSPEALAELFNNTVPASHPHVKANQLSKGRTSKAKAYLNQFSDREWWCQSFDAVNHSALLRGEKPSPGHENFIGDFDWFLTKGQNGVENCVKAYEGKYHDKTAQARASPTEMTPEQRQRYIDSLPFNSPERARLTGKGVM